MLHVFTVCVKLQQSIKQIPVKLVQYTQLKPLHIEPVQLFVCYNQNYLYYIENCK